MKILLINPMSDTHYRVPPLGLGYLARALRDHKHEVELLDCQRQQTSMQDIEGIFRESQPDVAGVQSFSCDFPTATEIIKLCKRIDPQVVSLLGGAHPSGVGKTVLEGIEELDFAFRGEAEESLPLFLGNLSEKGIEDLDAVTIPGLIWRKGDTIVENDQSYPADLDRLGFPLWELMDPRTYPRIPQGVFYQQAPIAPILTSRGCPFPCTFCAGKTLTGKKIRFRSVQHLMEEIDYLVKTFGIRELHIVDDTFTHSKKRVLEFCESLQQKNHALSFTFPNGIRLDTLDREVLTAMKDAGCYAVIVGIESGSQKILEDMKKRSTLHQIREKVTLIHSVGLRVRGFFIIGYPTETRDDIQKTIDFSRSLPLSGAHFSSFLPLPGTEITDTLVSQGTLTHIPYESLFYSLSPLAPEGMTRKELKSWLRKAYFRFYFRPVMFWRILREIRSWEHFKALFKRFVDYAL